MPAIGYDDPNQSHFTSRHFWEVGALDPGGRDRLARPLPGPRRRGRQPDPGPGARLHARARAGAAPVAGRGRRVAGELRLLDPRRLGRRRVLAVMSGFGDLGNLRDGRPGARAGARRDADDDRACATSSPPMQGARRHRGARRRTRRRRSVPAPAARRSREHARARPAARAASRVEGNGGYDTHANQNGVAAGRHRAAVAGAGRVPGRPRGARPRRPGARARVERVRAPRPGERRRAPITARPGCRC